LGVNSLVVISAFISVTALPSLWFFGDGSLLPDNMSHMFVFALIGLLHTALLWFYLSALTEEDTTTVVIFYSVLPVLGFITSNIFLGEVLLKGQLIAMAIIISAVLLVSFEKDESSKIRFKFRAAILMFLASLCWALGDVAFKFVALEENVMRSLFWEHVVLFIIGATAFMLVPRIRTQISHILKQNKRKVIAINLASEVLYMVANVVSAFPLIIVQVATVHLVQAFQPIWVFLIGVLLWKTGKTSETFSRTQLIQKGLATIIAVLGMYLLMVSTVV
jgi:drug/metabolite transporter (DMT)-like permease